MLDLEKEIKHPLLFLAQGTNKAKKKITFTNKADKEPIHPPLYSGRLLQLISMKARLIPVSPASQLCKAQFVK